jgi:hypothetical protein
LLASKIKRPENCRRKVERLSRQVADTWINERDGSLMRLIPAGEFIMGSTIQQTEEAKRMDKAGPQFPLLYETPQFRATHSTAADSLPHSKKVWRCNLQLHRELQPNHSIQPPPGCYGQAPRSYSHV